MITWKYLILIAVLILSGCDNDEHSDRNSKSFSTLTGSYVFEVDRVSNHPNVQFPDELSESNYLRISEVSKYDIDFSDDGEAITIKQNSLFGKKTNIKENMIEYNISESTFAGGRFLVWINGEDFEAELTIYGSGVPIIISERGYLIPDS